MSLLTGGFIGIVLVILLLVVGVAVVIKSMVRIAGTNEALLISGKGRKDAEGKDSFQSSSVVVGRRTYVVPGFTQVDKLLLNSMTSVLEVNAPSVQAIDLSIKATVIYKIGNTEVLIRNAASRWVGKQTRQEMEQQIHPVLDGHLRSIIGSMSVEDILRKRDTLASQVRAAMADEMANMGLVVDSLQIREIEEDKRTQAGPGYIEALSAPHRAEVQSAARIAQAERDRAATEAEQTAAVAMAEAKTVAAKRQAELQAEADTARRKSEQAGPLAQALAEQQVVVAQTRAAELAADLKAKQLETEVRKPADASAYAAKVQAEGQRDAEIASAEAAAKRTTLEAEAAATRTRLAAEAQAAKTTVEANASAEATRATGTAEADATRARGLAAAEATKASGMAEADAMSARADALAKGQDALISQQVAAQLPQIVAELVKPFGNIDKLTVLNGAEGMTQMVVGGLGQLENVLPTLMRSIGASKVDKAEDA